MLITCILIKKSVVMQIMKLIKINNNYNILTTIKQYKHSHVFNEKKWCSINKMFGFN